jgi:urease accessory protein UreH
VGTIGARLELSFVARSGRTTLEHSYAEPPFRVGRTFDLDGAAYAIIVCAGPGVFAGDTLRQTVHVAPGARVVLTSQAALQIHPGVSSLLQSCDSAILQSRYIVASDAELHCHWDPVIPFAGARLDQRIELQIASDSRLYWSDAMMAGRVTRGETWQFDSLAHQLALRVDGALQYLERYALEPSARRDDRPWITGGATYFGTTLVHHGDASADVAERWHHALLRCHRTVHFGVDLIAPGLIAARSTSADGAAFARFRAAYRAAALDDIFRAPQFAGRK